MPDKKHSEKQESTKFRDQVRKERGEDVATESIINTTNLEQNQENPDVKPGKSASEYEEEIATLKDTLLRTIADSENAKKRLMNDRDSAVKYAIVGVVKDLALLIDHFYLSTSSVKEEDLKHEPLKHFYDAINLTLSDVMKFLEKNNVRRINPINEAFNPKEHDAVSQVKMENVQPGMVIQVLSAGYAIEDRIIKPAMVVVSG